MRMDRRLCFSPNSMHIWNKYNITWANRGSLGDWITAGSTITGLAPEGIYVDGTRISTSTTIYRDDLLSNMPNYNSSYSVSSNGFIELSGDVTSSSEVYTSCNNIIARKIGSSSINYRVFSGGIWYWKKYKGIINGYIATPDGNGYSADIGTYYESYGYNSYHNPFDFSSYDERDLEVWFNDLDGSGDYNVRITRHFYKSNSILSVDENGITLAPGDVGGIPDKYGNMPKYAIEIGSLEYWGVVGEGDSSSLTDEEWRAAGFATSTHCYEVGGTSNYPKGQVLYPSPSSVEIGSYIGLVKSDNQNRYPKNGYILNKYEDTDGSTNYDPYYYEFDHYGDAVKGTTYLGQVKDKNENAYPDNGLYNGYWYVKVK